MVTGPSAVSYTHLDVYKRQTDDNAHPHLGGPEGRLALIHNGIIENFHSLKTELLAQGVTFASETDTEVAAHLVAAAYERTHDLTAAMLATVARLHLSLIHI